MKRNLLKLVVLVAAMMMSLGASAIDKVVKKTEMTGEVTSLEALKASKFMLQNSAGQILYTPDGWDVKVAPNLITAVSNKGNGGMYALEDGPEDGQFVVAIYNFDGNRRTFWAGNQCLNSQPVGGNVIFGLSGAAPNYGQDGQNLALWSITYEAGSGFAFHCVGRDIYLGADASAARPVEEVTYWKAYTGYIAGYDEDEVLDAYNAVVAVAKTSETINALLDAKLAYDSDVDLDKFGDAVNAAIDEVNACAALNAAYSSASLDAAGATAAGEVLAKYEAEEYANVAELQAAYYAAVKAQTTAGANMTLAIVNPSFEDGTINGWTSNNCGAVANNYNFGARTGDKFCERWTGAPGKLSDGTFLQTLSGMPNGKYKLTAELQNREQGNSDAAGHGFFLVANEGQTEGVTNNGETITTYGVVTDGSLTIGVKLEGCTGNWICFDNFQLTYLGTIATDEELADLTAEIAIAKTLGVDVAAYEAGVFTASEVPAAVEALKVAEYVQVNTDYTLNAATLIPDFSEWEGEMVSNKGQHWDGTGTSTYYEQTGAQWGQSSWTNNKKVTVELPKGKYVLYAAGRASAGTACTAYIKVGDVTRTYTSKGDVGYGIATDGTASFDPSANYANDGKGRGFEYRYVAFEITEDKAEIALEVGGEATANHQWMSVTAPVLLTTADNTAILLPVLRGKVTAAKADLEAVKGTAGEGLFLKPQAAYDEYADAVAAADNLLAGEPTAAQINDAISAIDEKAAAFAAAPVTAPDADKLYTFQLKLGGETPLYMNLTADGITIAEAATPLKFIATEKAGQFNLSDEEGNLFVGLAGGNAWTMSTAVDKKAAWTFTALGDGAYRINNLVTTGRFVGTNSADKDAGKPCYADKQTSNGNVDWIIAEVAGPVEPVDYTSYIKDADFATTGGWTENVSDGYRNYGVFAIGGDEMVQFAPPTADETHLTTEYAAGFEARWATSFASYIQTIAELPAGNYKLTYDVENVNANTAAANYNNLFTVTVGEKVFMDESTEWMSDKTAWTQHTIRFTVEEASPVTISFGYGTGENNFPASDTPALYVSHLKLDTYDPVADNKDELTEVITYAEALAADELKTEGVEEFADAISTAKYVLETATTAEELANAIDALRAAITTFTLANQFIWDGVVYIIDVETGKKMAAGHDWGTRGIVNDLGLDLTLVSDETTRTVTIDSRVSNGGQRHFLGSNLYMDSPAFGWILQYRGFGFYISNGTKYISLDENDNLVLSETPHEWILVTSDGVKEQLLSEMADATAESPVDATFFIKANNFNRNDLRIAESWTVSADCTNSNLCGGSDVNRCAESYHSTFTISQTIEGLPAGVYKMTAQGFYRQDEALEEDAPVFFANDAVAALPAKAGEENNMSDASAAFTSGLYTIEPIEFVVGEEGVVTLGVKNESATNQWIVFDNFQLTYYGAEQPEPVETELELALDVERYTGMGYNVTEASVDFAEAKEFLGVDEITYDMLRIVNPDGEEISDYAPYDGWFNADGVAETWGSNTKVCVKFWQAIEDGKYEICDMNGADEVGKTYTVKWALVANDKKVFYTINVKFVDKPAIAITYDDLNIVETVTSDFSFEVGTCYQGSTATVDVAAILAELGVASLDDVTIYAVQSDKSLDDNYKLGTTDGWRNAAGDWQGWGADAYFYVKADFSAAESQLYQVGTMDPESNTNIAADDVYTAKYVFVKGDDAHSAVELDVVVTMTSAVGINGIALDAENSAVYDLTGRRVKNVVKGNLYIVNGKKVLVK